MANQLERLNKLRKLLPFLEKDIGEAAQPLEREAAESTLPASMPKEGEVIGEGTSQASPKDLPIEDADTLSPQLNDIDMPSSLQDKWNNYKKGMAVAGTGAAATGLAMMNGGDDGQQVTPPDNKVPNAPAPLPANGMLPETNEDKAMKSMMAQLAIPSAAERITVPKTSVVDFSNKPSVASMADLRAVQDRQNLLNGLAGFQNDSGLAYDIAGVERPKGVNWSAGAEHFKGLAKNVGDQYDKRVAFEKEDANSPMSEGYRQLAKAMGFEIKGNASAADLEKLYPQLSNIYTQREAQSTRRDIARENREGRLAEMKLRYAGMQDQKQKQSNVKRFDDLNKKLMSELASSRTTFGLDSRTLQGVQNVKALVQGRDPNELDNREVYEAAKVLDRVLSQGNPTIAGSSKLTPDTARGLVAKYMEFLGNKRQSAQAGSFVNQFMTSLNKEEKTATNRIVQTQGKLLSSYADLKQQDPDKWDLIMQQHHLPPDILERHVVSKQVTKQGGEAPVKTDPKITKYAQQYNMTYEDALKLLQSRGYNGGQ